MLDALRIPTPLLEPGEQPPVTITYGSMDRRYPTLHLIRTFGGFLARHLWRRITGRADLHVTAVALRETIEALGGLWIKVGQLLSLRNDIFPDVICKELAGLQYRALGFPFPVVKEVIEAELRAPMASIFSAFEEVPLAAASVSQVHRAVLLHDKTIVVVKVQRPNAQAVFRRDLRNIGRFISLIEAVKFAPHVHWRQGLEALESMVVEEIDFRYEAANMRRMRKSLREHKVYVPKVFLDRCTSRVLVSEYLAGVLMSDYIRIGHGDPARVAAWAAENRVEPKKVAQRLFNSAVRQFLEDNLFHGDLHPGNIMLLRDNRFALIDFGTIGSYDHSFLATYKASLAALAEKDYLRAADMTLRLAISPPGPGVLDQLRTEIVASYREWDARSHLAGVDYHERSLAAAGSDSGRIMFRYKVQMTWDFMRISRTWSTLDASLSFLTPEANYMKMFGRYFEGAKKRAMAPGRVLSNIVQSVVKTAATVREYHDLVAPIIRKQAILRPNFINAGERFLRFARTWFRIFANLVLVGAVIGGLMELDHYHPNLFAFENTFLHELADDDLTGEEIWWLALAACIIVGWMIRRALRSVDRDP